MDAVSLARAPHSHGTARARLTLGALAILAAVMTCLAAAGPAGAAVPGDQLWRRLYNGPGNADDRPSALAVAPGGKAVYVAGSVTPAGGVQPDLAIIKYKAGGTRLWVRTYGGAFGGADGAAAAVCDSAGNIYVGGSKATATGLDFLLIKYAPSGARKWVRTWDGPGHGDDAINALAVDARGNVYAAGMTWAPATGTDAALVKWTPAGRRAWRRMFVSDGVDSYTCLIVDKARGRIYAGGVDGTGSEQHWLLARYTVGGKRTWVSQVGDPGTFFYTTSLALTPGGAIIMAGRSDTGTTASSDGRLGRWSSAGTFKAASSFSGSAHDYDVINDVTVQRDGTIIAVGTAHQSPGHTDAFIARYASSTAGLGFRNIDSGFNDGFTSVARDSKGNLYATGRLGAAAGKSDVLTVRLSPTLAVRWQKTKRISWVPGWSEGVDIAVRRGDYAGVYVAAAVPTLGIDWDWLTLKYKP